MISKVFVTVGVLIFTALIPYLEINASHVFNETWPPHAKFHEVWQLTTNCGIGLLCLWLAWIKNEIPIASILVSLVMGGVLVSHAVQDTYGGSILSGNSTVTVLGIGIAALAAGLAVVLAVAASILDNRSKSRSE